MEFREFYIKVEFSCNLRLFIFVVVEFEYDSLEKYLNYLFINSNKFRLEFFIVIFALDIQNQLDEGIKVKHKNNANLV